MQGSQLSNPTISTMQSVQFPKIISNQNQTGPLAELAIIVVLVVFPFARMRTAFILLAGTMESTRSNAAKKLHMLTH